MMSLMMTAVLLAAALLAPQEKNEAEEHFKKVEEKLLKAKSMQVKVTGTAPMGAGQMTFDSTLLIDDGNRARADSELKTPMGAMKFTTLSSGSQLWSQKEGETRTADTPKTLTADLVRGFARAGGLFSAGWLDAMSEKNAPNAKRQKIPEIADFKLGKKEKVGEREAQAIDFTLKGLESGEVPVTLWIDLETHLPLKREIRGLHGQQSMTLVETYGELKLDPKLDPAKFEVPKESK
jgi:outer membrane lipoprotein-sorting protein